jgi:hypothetical protein
MGRGRKHADHLRVVSRPHANERVQHLLVWTLFRARSRDQWPLGRLCLRSSGVGSLGGLSIMTVVGVDLLPDVSRLVPSDDRSLDAMVRNE